MDHRLSWVRGSPASALKHRRGSPANLGCAWIADVASLDGVRGSPASIRSLRCRSTAAPSCWMDRSTEAPSCSGAKLELMGGGVQLHQDLYDIQIKDSVF